MAEPKPTRKSTRKFDLGKGERHSFDLDKGTNRKFDLEKEPEVTTTTAATAPENKKTGPVVAPVAPVTDPQTPTTVDDDTEVTTGGKKTWLWILIALIVAAVIAFICFRSCKDKQETVEQPATEQETTPQAGDTDESTATDAVTTDDEAASTDDATADDQPEAAAVGEDTPQGSTEESAQPAQSEQPAQPSQPAQSSQSAQPAQPVQSAQAAGGSNTTSPTPSATSADEVEAQALNVIRGDYGNAPERFERLRQNGLDPKVIQQRVNEMLRNGTY